MQIKNIFENYDQEDIENMAAGILRIAERRAYEESAEAGGNVTHDQIMAAAQAILRELENTVGDSLQQDFQASV